MSNQELDSFPHQNTDEEIDLVQLVQILWRRKSLIVFVAAICLLFGIGYVTLKEPLYEYVTAIQIGETFVGGSGPVKKHLIESPTSVKLKLEKVYLPMAIKQVKSRKDNSLPVVTIKVNKNSSILFVVSKGSLEDGQFLKELHTAIVSPLIANHRDLVAASKNQYDILAKRAKLILNDLEDPKIYGIGEDVLKREIESAQLVLAGIDDQNKNLLAQKRGLKETRLLLQQQIRQIEKNLKVTYAKRDKVISEVKEEAKAMTFLMLNSDIQQNENRLAALRERLNVKLENQKQLIEGKLSENKRTSHLQRTKIEELKSRLVHLQAQRSSDQGKQKSEIAEVKNKIALYQDTKVLDYASRSIKPVGPGKIIIIFLSGILGLMIGIMSAFFAEFMMKVRNHKGV